MNAPQPGRSPHRARRVVPAGFLAALALATGCSSGSSGSTTGNPNTPSPTGDFFVAPNQGGGASRLVLEEMFWGRLVDVHDIDASGETDLEPVFRDFVIDENIQDDGIDYRLETNPITGRTRLVVLRQEGAPDDGRGTFLDLVERAARGLPAIAPKDDDGTSPPPFSFVARNATVVLRFNDVLDDGPEAQRTLHEAVEVLTGYPPDTPFAPRILFDPNVGAEVGGEFHSTRILIDMTVSEAESSSLPVPRPVNTLGLPPSLSTTPAPNVSVRLPTRTDAAAGQFVVLEGLNGALLSTSDEENAPIDRSSPTLDIVRAMRSGNREDTNNGFLLDLNTPEIVGTWGVVLSSPIQDPTGEEGFDYLVDVQFSSQCESAVEAGDILSVGSEFLEVTGASLPPLSGSLTDVPVRRVASEPLVNLSQITGNGLFLSTFDPAVQVPAGCWISFTPQPGVVPASEVSTTAQVQVRFSEPMDPESLTAFGTFLVVRGDSTAPLEAENIVVGDVVASADLRTFAFSPILPFDHQSGSADPYHVRLDGPTDLAGNPLTRSLPRVDFSIDPTDPSERNSGVVLRFDSPDDLKPIGKTDIRGQVFFDLDRALIKPREVTFAAFPADRTNPVPAIMIPFPRGVQTPLTPLGSKTQAVWRYLDFGWNVRDETKYDLDVVGLNWSPIGGQVLSDFYDEFEMRLSHSRFLPDEDINQNLLPNYPNSGLNGSPSPFTVNILQNTSQEIVHPRALGYVINPAELFVSTTGTFMMPWPMNNQGGSGPLRTYTWRDTSILEVAGPRGRGIPTDIEAGAPLFLEQAPGTVASAGEVPTFGLPLLIEYRCYPSSEGLGLNSLDISLAVNSSVRPNFRAFSSGGVDTNGNVVTKNPDLELVPSGGFNPTSNPPGRPTRWDADNTFYIGQLDTVTRVSRAHTAWIDTLFASPEYLEPILEPGRVSQPAGTEIVIDYRGADGFDAAANDPFDAMTLDPYGDVPVFGSVVFLDGDATWRSEIDQIDGARYFQLRLTFLNNIETRVNPELSAIGVAFTEQ